MLMCLCVLSWLNIHIKFCIIPATQNLKVQAENIVSKAVCADSNSMGAFHDIL